MSHLLPHPEIKLGSLGESGTVQTCQTCLHPFFFSRFLLPSFSLKFIDVSADSSGGAFALHLWSRSNEESGVSALPQIWGSRLICLLACFKARTTVLMAAVSWDLFPVFTEDWVCQFKLSLCFPVAVLPRLNPFSSELSRATAMD